MTILELHSIIGGQLTDMFDYAINKDKRYKAIILEMEEMNTDNVRTISRNGFMAEILNCYFAENDTTRIQVYIRQVDITELEFID